MVHTYHTQHPEAKTNNSSLIPVNRPSFGQKKKGSRKNLYWQLAFVGTLLILVSSNQSLRIRIAGVFGQENEVVQSDETVVPVASKSPKKADKKPNKLSSPKGKPAASKTTVEVKEIPSGNRAEQFKNYVDRYAPIAIAEKKQFGIPASIILAQGLLESNAGKSGLAQHANNHFGIKCFSRRCRKGHCMNFTDDTHKDFFMKYSNVWSSYRAHSEFLHKSGRYRSLFKLGPKDYQGWARGLARLGYATDRQYGEKLIALIQSQRLNQYD